MAASRQGGVTPLPGDWGLDAITWQKDEQNVKMAEKKLKNQQLYKILIYTRGHMDGRDYPAKKDLDKKCNSRQENRLLQ